MVDGDERDRIQTTPYDCIEPVYAKVYTRENLYDLSRLRELLQDSPLWFSGDVL
jgi:hypothetical protein